MLQYHDEEEVGDESSQLVLVSIGSVLIDAFDFPPEPSSFHSHSNSYSTQPQLPTIPPPGPTSKIPFPYPTPRSSHPNLHLNLISNPSTPTHTPPTSAPSTPTSTSSTSISTSLSIPCRSSTPQLDFSAYPPAPENPYEQLGGGALYSLIGSRIWLPARCIRTLVNRAPGGEDITRDQLDILEGFGKDIWRWNEAEGARMIRARIRYDGGRRIFQHIVKSPHRTFESLLSTPLQNAQYLHISPPFSPQDLNGFITEMNSSASSWRPKIIFEPAPQSCHPGQRSWFQDIAGNVHVLSPNHEELLSLYSKPILPLDDPALRSILEEVIHHLLHDIGVGHNGQGVVAIRCAGMGSVVGTKSGGTRWFPAFFSENEAARVVDVTGGGNAYLGGFVAGLHYSRGDPYEAALYATVSASYIIEQMGLPRMEENKGLWNGEEPRRRLETLRQRLKRD